MSQESRALSQEPYRCKLEWGRHGAREAAARGDVLVVVDTLSFSTAVVTAVHRGALIYPCAVGEDPAEIAQSIGGEIAVGRRDVPGLGRFSLSPATYADVQPGTRIVLPSPNGATCSRHAGDVPYLFVGALVNARAVAAAVSQALTNDDLSVTVVACGERWRPSTEDGELRVAVEDYLGAGAILAYLPHAKSPEASVCASACTGSQGSLGEILWDCVSGRELREGGYADDVLEAARLNLYDSVPVMRGDHLELFGG